MQLDLLSRELVLFAAVGFVAQLIDGAAGMAYGVSATTVLLSLGVEPATASAAVHAAEVFTTGASGLSHLWVGNVRGSLVLRLAIPGMVGGAAGAVVLSSIPAETIRPWVSLYLCLMGGLILWKAWRPSRPTVDNPRFLPALGLIGGFLDAAGGGGWGPIVASTLIGGGTVPRYAIGSVNLAEFFVTSVVTATFFVSIGLELWPVIVGLIIGGVTAAPVAAIVAKRLPSQPLMVIVGTLVIVLSLKSILVGRL